MSPTPPPPPPPLPNTPSTVVVDFPPHFMHQLGQPSPYFWLGPFTAFVAGLLVLGGAIIAFYAAQRTIEANAKNVRDQIAASNKAAQDQIAANAKAVQDQISANAKAVQDQIAANAKAVQDQIAAAATRSPQ